MKGLELAKKATFKAVSAMSSQVKKRLGEAFKIAANSVKRLISSLARMAKIGVAAFAAVTFAALKMGVAFEKNIAMVATMLDPKTMAMLPKFEEGIRKIAVEFGESTKTLSKGMFDILSASVAPEKALTLLALSAEAAVGGMTTTAVAADTLTTVMNSYAVSADDARMLSDKLFATVKKGKITYEQLATNLGKVASTAAIAGLDINEMFAALATMTRGGASAEQAVTSLMATLTAFIRPSESAKKEAKKFGIEMTAAGLSQEGLIKVVERLNKLNADQLGLIIENVRAFRGFAIVLKDVAGFNETLEFVATKSAGKTAEAYKKMAATASFKLGVVWAKLKDTGLAVHKRYEVPFKNALDKVNKHLEKNKTKIIEWSVLVGKKIKNAFTKPEGVKELFLFVTDELTGLVAKVFPIAVKVGVTIIKGILAGMDQLRKELADALGELIFAESQLKDVIRRSGGKVTGFAVIKEFFWEAIGAIFDPKEWKKVFTGFDLKNIRPLGGPVLNVPLSKTNGLGLQNMDPNSISKPKTEVLLENIDNSINKLVDETARQNTVGTAP